jgi:hypothetical protein
MGNNHKRYKIVPQIKVYPFIIYFISSLSWYHNEVSIGDYMLHVTTLRPALH